jgi:hypothetical protein
LRNRLLDLQAEPRAQRIENALSTLGRDSLRLVVFVSEDLLNRHIEGVSQVAQ